MKLPTITCESCKDTIYSRANHDFRSCSCGEISVDAGPGIGRVCGNWDGKFSEIELDVTKEDLYKDWNLAKDKYGLIKNRKKKVKSK